MKLGKLQEKSFPVAIDFGDGDIVRMSMRPHVDGHNEAIALSKQLEDSEDGEETSVLIREKFCRTVTQWDSQDDNNNDIPLTPEGILAANIPASLLGMLLVKGYEEVANSKKPGRRR